MSYCSQRSLCDVDAIDQAFRKLDGARAFATAGKFRRRTSRRLSIPVWH
jgi:hypothetical protein